MIEIGLGDLPLGDVPRRNDALGEFHCIRPDPRYAGWHEPTNHWTWQSSNWRVGEDADGRFIEQLHDSRYNNTLILNDTSWRNVRRVEVQMFYPKLTREVGVVFAYLFERSRSLFAPWAAHAAFNIFNLMLVIVLFG